MMIIALLLTIVAGAQTLNVQVGDVTYQFPASQTGDMTYSNGTTLTIMGKEFAISDITGMVVDKSEVTDNQVTVSYNGTTAKVTVAGNVAQYLTPVVSGAHVSIAQSDDLAEEVTYTLSGESTDGEFYMSGSYKATVEREERCSRTYPERQTHQGEGVQRYCQHADGCCRWFAEGLSVCQRTCRICTEGNP